MRRVSVVCFWSNFRSGTSPVVPGGFSNLVQAPQEARDIADLLRDPNIAAFDDVLIGENLDSEDALTLIDHAVCLTEGGLLLLYLIGHGLPHPKYGLLLPTSKTAPDNPQWHSVRFREIIEALKPHHGNSLVIIDTCNSGNAVLSSELSIRESIRQIEGPQLRLTVLASCKPLSSAFEDKSGYSVFSRHVVRGIRSGEADLDGDGQITLNDFVEYLRQIENQESAFVTSSYEHLVLAKTPNEGDMIEQVLPPKLLANAGTATPLSKKEYVLGRQLKAHLYKGTIDRTGVFIKSPDAVLEFNEQDFLKEAQTCPMTVVIGTRGAGKSDIARRLFWAAPDLDIYPVFLNWNDKPSYDIITAIWKLHYSLHVRISSKTITKSLSAERYLIIVDGFETAPESCRALLATYIADITGTYPLINWMILCRPTARYEIAGSSCMAYEVAPIDETERDSIIGSEFVARLGAAFISEYVSTPLDLEALLSSEISASTNRLLLNTKEQLVVQLASSYERLYNDFARQQGYPPHLRVLWNLAYNALVQPDVLATTPSEIVPILKKMGWYRDGRALFPHAELQRYWAARYISDEYTYDLPSESQQQESSRLGLPPYLAILLPHWGDRLAKHLLGEFQRTGDPELLLDSIRAARNCSIGETTRQSIATQLINIYDLYEERFYPLWFELHSEVFSWEDPLLLSRLRDYLSSSPRLRALQLNVIHHFLGLLSDNLLINELVKREPTYRDDNHMIYSLLEIQWLRRRAEDPDALRERLGRPKTIIEFSLILKLLDATQSAWPEDKLISFAGSSERGSVIRYMQDSLIKYFSTSVPDYERGHALIELAAWRSESFPELLKEAVSDSASRGLRYHAHYSLEVWHHECRYFRIPKGLS